MKPVYKYMSEVAAISFLKDPWIRVTPKPALNDPFECTPTQQTKDRIVKIFKGEKSLSEHPDIVIDNFADVMDYFGIVSFSKSFNDLLMWSHYADSHKGVMLEFDLDEIHEVTRLYSDKIEDNVNYSDLRAFKGSFKNLNEVRRYYFLTKSMPWKKEEEYRLVLPVNHTMKIAFDLNSEGSRNDMQNLGFNYTNYPVNHSPRFTEKFHLDHLRLNKCGFNKLFDVWLNSSETNTQFYQYVGYKALKRIYLGANSNVENFKILFEELSDDPDPYRIFKSMFTEQYYEIYHMRLDLNKYELVEQPL